MTSVAVIGAGPAGLTAAYLLQKKGFQVDLFESDPSTVGGLSKTIKVGTFNYDIGGHRYLTTKETEKALRFWQEIMGDEFLKVNRKSQIFFRGMYFSYPIQWIDLIRKISFVELLAIVFSYFGSCFYFFKRGSLENFYRRRFGKKVYEMFFKSYTRKILGLDCGNISADWGASRVGSLSIVRSILNRRKVKSLSDFFYYPRRGAGALWEECLRKFQDLGGVFYSGQRITKISVAAGYCVINKNEYEHIVSTACFHQNVKMLSGTVSERVQVALDKLRYRDFIIIAIEVKTSSPMEGQWLYVQDDVVNLGRIQNFTNWSPEMTSRDGSTVYGLEYFCNHQTDQIWRMNDEELKQIALRDLEKVGLDYDEISGFSVEKVKKAYPIYVKGYREAIQVVEKEVFSDLSHFHRIGRNSLFKYCNQDHVVADAIDLVAQITT